VQKNSLLREIKKLRSKRLITITAKVEGEEYILLYQFDDVKDIFNLELRFPKSENKVDSIYKIFPGADIMEREVHDLYGVEFEGNPNMEHKLFLPEDWEGDPPRRDG